VPRLLGWFFQTAHHPNRPIEIQRFRLTIGEQVMANELIESYNVDASLTFQRSGVFERAYKFCNGLLTTFATVISGYFILAAGSL